ncbi:MAG: hypothetical protein KGQ59_10935 [Bdellovibrionales bacterium]|nr:hypothetical protein [Bdellovibrionales bacterium]
MNHRKLGWAGLLVLGILMNGCGVQPRPNPESPESSVLGQIPDRKAPGKSADLAEVETSGIRWTIRSARPESGSNPHSRWSLGDGVSYRTVVEASRAAISEALPWPDEPSSILLVQFRGLRSGDWSFRCVRPDGEVEESSPTQRLEWDLENDLGIIPLHSIFGQRGEKRDPSTVCHVLLRFQDSGESRTLELSIRVLSGLPAPEPGLRQDFGLSVGGIIRQEQWRNETFRPLQLTLEAKVDLEVTTWLEQRAYLQGNGRAYLPEPHRMLHSLAQRSTIQARYTVGSGWSNWGVLPQTVRWPSGTTVQVEYRLAAGSGVSECSRADRLVTQFPFTNLKIFHEFGLSLRHFRGSLTWIVGVQDPTKLGDTRGRRRSEKTETQEFFEPPPQISSSAFDCQGWVP